MKLFIKSLWTAIKNNILRIFPLPKIILYLIVFVVVCTLYGCATPKQVTQQVHDVRVDTIYLSTVQYDSIYIYQDKCVDRSRDTLYVKDKSVEYRYKLLRDTVREVERDSIPYEVTITEVKEIIRPLTWFDQLCRICFSICLSGFVMLMLCLIKGIRSKL